MRVVVFGPNQGQTRRLVEEAPRRAYVAGPARARGTHAEHVPSLYFAEDEIFVDVGEKEDRARREGESIALVSVHHATLVGLDARKRRLYVLGDVVRIDRAHASAVAGRQRETGGRPRQKRSTRRHR